MPSAARAASLDMISMQRATAGVQSGDREVSGGITKGGDVNLRRMLAAPR